MEEYDDGYRYSFPLGTPILLCPLLAWGTGSGWGPLWTAVAAALAAVFTWEAFSQREFESICARDPSMNLATWRFNWLLFFVLPFAAVAGYGVLRLLRA
jgi:hypothetical protein